MLITWFYLITYFVLIRKIDCKDTYYYIILQTFMG